MKVSVATGLENESLIYCFPNCKFSQDPPPEGKGRVGECGVVVIKGTVSRGGNFFEGLNILISTFRRLPVGVFSVKIIALGSLKRVTGRIFNICMLFQRSKQKLQSLICRQLRDKKIVKTTVSAHGQKVPLLLLKNIHLVTQSL
jgi:hypothetical protein